LPVKSGRVSGRRLSDITGAPAVGNADVSYGIPERIGARSFERHEHARDFIPVEKIVELRDDRGGCRRSVVVASFEAEAAAMRVFPPKYGFVSEALRNSSSEPSTSFAVAARGCPSR